MEESDIKPWYKQFWPWFLICIPVSSFIVGGIVISFATDGTNSLVVDDYYKEGKSINARLDKVEAARALNISTQLKISDELISVEFLTGAPESKEALRLDFFHVTQDASGIYRAEASASIKGKWRLRLTPLDEHWKVQKTITLPTYTAISFNP
jgi:hypothetical protein